MTRPRKTGVVHADWYGCDEVLAHGHLEEGTAEAAEAIEQAREWLDREDEEPRRLGLGWRGHARWQWSSADCGEIRRCLETCPPGQGAMPVTEIIDLDDRDRRRAEEAERVARREDIARRVLERWPDATEVEARWDGRSVRFRRPRLLGCVDWDGGHSAWVQQRDLDAWNGMEAAPA